MTDRSTARRLAHARALRGRRSRRVVWTTVTFEEDATRGKDRPVRVMGRKDERTVQALLSSRLRRSRDRNWLGRGRGAWDDQGQRSFVRLDRVLELDETSLRRESAALPPELFERVCDQLRSRYGWSRGGTWSGRRVRGVRPHGIVLTWS